MRRFRKPALGTLAALAVLFAAVPLSARMRVANQRIDSQFDPEEDSRHPAELALAMVLNEDHPSGAGVCVSYSHDRSTRPNRGRVAIAMRVFRSDRPSRPPVELVALDFGRMKVESGRAVDCKRLEEPLRAGDGIEFEFRFKGRPPIRAAGGEAMLISGSVRRE